MQWALILRRSVLDLAAWLVVPAVFLFFYTRYPQVPRAGVAAHLHVVAVVLLATAMVRLALARFMPADRPLRIASAVLVSALIAAMLLYYALVLLGLQSWGRVISWNLITSYAAQAPALADALGVSLYAVAAALAVSYLALLAGVWLYLGRFDWAAQLSRSVSSGFLVIFLAAGSAMCAIQLYNFIASPPIAQAEPLSLTLFPLQSARGMQTVAVNNMRAQRLDTLADAARASYRANPQAARKNVILIVVDALRADRLGMHGYARDTTPRLDRLHAAGRIREPAQMRSSCGASVCGLLSMLTSRYVHEFSNKPFTLHEVLRRHGYEVHMILGGDHGNFHGFYELYGNVDSYYDAASVEGVYMNDDRIVLDRTAALPPWRGRPMMIQFHLMSAHGLGKRHDTHARFTPARSYIVPGKRTRELVDNFYDNGVLQADAVIDELLGALERKGYLREALVVITADHGESLGEGGRYSHAKDIYEEVLRIPLLLIAYGYTPAPLSGDHLQASQVDIAPTILAELGMPRPGTWSGVPLQEPVERAYTYFQEGPFRGFVDVRDRKKTWKYWIDTRSGCEHAYDLSADPKEVGNAIDAAPPALRQEWRLHYLRTLNGGTEFMVQQ